MATGLFENCDKRVLCGNDQTEAVRAEAEGRDGAGRATGDVTHVGQVPGRVETHNTAHRPNKYRVDGLALL